MPINSEHIHLVCLGVWLGWLSLSLLLVIAYSERFNPMNKVDVANLEQYSKEELINLYQQMHAASKGLPMPQTGEIAPEDHAEAMLLFDLAGSARLVAWLNSNEDGTEFSQLADAIDQLTDAVKASGLLGGVI